MRCESSTQTTLRFAMSPASQIRQTRRAAIDAPCKSRTSRFGIACSSNVYQTYRFSDVCCFPAFPHPWCLPGSACVSAGSLTLRTHLVINPIMRYAARLARASGSFAESMAMVACSRDLAARACVQTRRLLRCFLQRRSWFGLLWLCCWSHGFTGLAISCFQRLGGVACWCALAARAFCTVLWKPRNMTCGDIFPKPFAQNISFRKCLRQTAKPHVLCH